MEDLGFLTRAHGVKVAPCFPCSEEEEVRLAVGDVVGDDSVKSAARINGAVVLFLDRVEKVNAVVVSGIVVRGTFVPVVPLAAPAVRVTIANVPPFIKEEVLMKELVKHGKVVSWLKMILSGWKSPQMRHMWSHRRHLFMILNNRSGELCLRVYIKVAGHDYPTYISSGNGRCFICGHRAWDCHRRRAAEQNTSGAASQGQNQEGPEGTGGGGEGPKLPRLKGKCRGDGENPQAKKVTAGRRRSRRNPEDKTDVARQGGGPLLQGQILPLCHLPHAQ